MGVVQSRTIAQMDPMGPSELENAWHSPAVRGPEVLRPKKNLDGGCQVGPI